MNIRNYGSFIFPFILVVLGLTQSYAAEKLPVVYSSGYNLGTGYSSIDSVLQNLHPFEMRKYEKIHEYLKTNLSLKNGQFYTPKAITNDDLLKVHSQEYLDSLNWSYVVSQGIDLWLAFAAVPNFVLQSVILEPMRLATGGTIKAAQLAMSEGWAINLAGGYHHSKPDSGEGGCIFADAYLAIVLLREERPNLKVLIVDTDAHQGNGNAAFAQSDKNLFIFDMYNRNEYPVYDQRTHDDPIYDGKKAREHIKFDCPLDGGYMGTTAFSQCMGLSIPWLEFLGTIDEPKKRSVNDTEYLAILKQRLPTALDTLKNENRSPDLIIYNAGSDIFEEDDLGILNVSKAGIIERDRFVWNLARSKNIPIVMLPSGGYGPKSPEIVAESMTSIIRYELKNK